MKLVRALPGTLCCNAVLPYSLFPLVARRATDKKSFVAGGAKKNSSKLNERRGNVYENKGPLWKT
jgi:hypothetical protein